MFRLCTAAGFAALSLLAGCGKTLDDVKPNVDPKYKEADDLMASVEKTLAQLPTTAGNPAEFDALFAEPGAVPKDRAPFAKLKFSVDSLPKLVGENMDMTVQVAQADNSKLPLSLPWKFRKVGDAWKVVQCSLAESAVAKKIRESD